MKQEQKIDFKSKLLKIDDKRRKIKIPIIITRKNKEEYESEEEIEVYYSNSTDSEIEIASDDDWLYLEEFKKDNYKDVYLQDIKIEEQNREIKEHLKIGKKITL